MDNVALITGASSGIGAEIARIHAAKGGDLVLVARREDRLRDLAEQLVGEHGVEVLTLARDLKSEGATEGLFREVQQRGIDIELLVNNAGYGGHGLFHERPWDEEHAMIDLNVVALASLTRLLLPGMVARGHGRVLNVGSIAGFVPGPLMAVYYATKAFVVSFSEAIGEELRGTGVTVTVLCPGPTRTEFAEVADIGGVRFFRAAASARAVAEYGHRAAMKGRSVAIPGAANNFLVRWLVPLAPRGWVTRASRSMAAKAGV